MVRGVAFRADVIADLPDAIIRYLHEGLDRGRPDALPLDVGAVRRFETQIIERLFPERDLRGITTRLRLHSHVTAVAARVIARRVGLPSETAFACGWLHDLGIASCLRHLDQTAPVDDDDQLVPLWPLLVTSSPTHAYALMSRWRLPSSLRYALREHLHATNHTRRSPLAQVTHVAEHVASTTGCGFYTEQPPFGLRSCLLSLGLSDRDLLPLERETEREFAAVEVEWRSLRSIRSD